MRFRFRNRRSLNYLSNSLVFLIVLAGCAHPKHKKSSQTFAQKEILAPTLEESWDDMMKEQDDPHEENAHALVEISGEELKNSDITESDISAAERSDDEAEESNQQPFKAPYFSKITKQWVDYFSKKQRARFQRFINNGELYRPLIEPILAQYDLPRELFYVGLIESGFYLKARSHAAATGPWQFMRPTAKQYGLKVTHEVDERRDIFKATHAAAKYFRELYRKFQSWDLALAAYNLGENGLARRMRRSNAFTYAALSRKRAIPAETLHYVPKVRAAMHIIENAAHYGFKRPRVKNNLWVQSQLKKVPAGVSLKKVAHYWNIPLRTLTQLNPELNYTQTPRLAHSWNLRVPAVSINATSPVSQRRESQKLASSFLSKESQSSSDSSQKITRPSGQKFVLRKPSSPLKASSDLLRTQRSAPLKIKVRRGENLTVLSQLLGISIREIKKSNRLKSSKLSAGKILVVPKLRKKIHIVKKGDHLRGLSKKYRLSQKLLLRLNDLEATTLKVGQKLVIASLNS